MIETKQEQHILSSSRRRWFSDAYFDLIVWQDENGEILQFELCYNKNKDEHAFVWSKQAGSAHLKVDDGELVMGRHKMSPVFIADGFFDSETLTARFLEAAEDIDQELTTFVCSKLKGCNKLWKKG